MVNRATSRTCVSTHDTQAASGAASPRADLPEATADTLPDRRPNMRLDPFGLQQGIHFRDADGTSFTIDRQGAVMKKWLMSSGLAVSMALPARAFRGVAARAIEHDDGSYTVSLELLHADPQLCVPLLVSDDLSDIAADWHAWSRLMRLPMLIIGASERAEPVREQLGEIMVETPLQRRKRYATLKHRPWFLRRRRQGRVGPVEKISGEELIARR